MLCITCTKLISFIIAKFEKHIINSVETCEVFNNQVATTGNAKLNETMAK